MMGLARSLTGRTSIQVCQLLLYTLQIINNQIFCDRELVRRNRDITTRTEFGGPW